MSAECVCLFLKIQLELGGGVVILVCMVRSH